MLVPRPASVQHGAVGLPAQSASVKPPARMSHWRVAVWLVWTLATSVGWCIGSILVLLALAWTSGAADAFVRSPIGSAVLGAAVGTSVGTGQWLVLRGTGAPGAAWRWLLASAASWAFGWAIGHALTDALIDEYWLLSLMPGGVLLAAIVSVSNWLSLRPYLRHASAWLPAGLLGWTAAGVVSMYGGGGLLGMGLSAVIGPTGWLIAILPGLFAGLVTGAALAALLYGADSPAPGTPDQRLATLSGH